MARLRLGDHRRLLQRTLSAWSMGPVRSGMYLMIIQLKRLQSHDAVPVLSDQHGRGLVQLLEVPVKIMRSVKLVDLKSLG